MPKRADATRMLTDRLVQALRDIRSAEPACYPLTVRELVDRAAPDLPSADIVRAVASKEFLSRVIVAQKKNLDSPVALEEDVDLLAGSRCLLEFALEKLSTSANCLFPIAKLKTQVVTRLKKPFEKALHERVQADKWPETVACEFRKKIAHVHLRRFTPSPPPIESLAEKLVGLFEARRCQTPMAYPDSIENVLKTAALEPPPAVLRKAIASPAFQSRVLLSVKGRLDAPAALRADLNQLASSPAMLDYILRSARKPASHTVPADKLPKKTVAELQPWVQEATRQHLAAGTLPPTVGWIWSGRKRLLFLLSDVQPGQTCTVPSAVPSADGAGRRSLPSPEVSSSANDFAQAFALAFARLDRQGGNHNFVSLADLRPALEFPRVEFDRGLQALRERGLYTLSAAEGRHGLDAASQSAGILEDGELLLYVSRRSA